MRFGGVQLRVISAGRSLEFVYILGEPQTLNVFPNFAAVARYAWLAGDRRLAHRSSTLTTQFFAQAGG